MSENIRLLLVEDSENDALLLIRALEKYGYTTPYRRVDTQSALREALEKETWDVVLIDYSLSGFSGLEALHAILSSPQRPGLVIVSGTISEDMAVATLKAGAHDYVLKDNLKRLGPAVDHALREARQDLHRQRADEELRRSEDKYRRLHESMRDSFVNVDMSGRILESNKAFQDMLGYGAEELIMLANASLIPERWHAGEAEVFQSQVLQREFSDIYEIEYRRKDGTIIPVELRRVLLKDDEGNPAGVWSTIREISGRKDMENRLEGEKALLLTLINNLPDLIYQKDLESRFVMGNRGLADFMGVADPANLVGKTDHDFCAGELADILRADEQIVMQTGSGQINKEEQIKSISSPLRWLLTTKVPVFDERGIVKGIVGIGRDITERKEKEREWRELSAAIEHAPDSILVTDTNGAITYVNPAFEGITGYSRSEVLGKTPRILKSGAQDAVLYRGMWEAIASGKVWRGQLLNIRKDGSRYHEHKTIAPITDEAGIITGFVGIGRDVSQEIALEAQLRRAQRLESLGTLASGIAHDLNNILTPILMGVEGLSLQHSDAYSRKILDIIATTAQRGADIVRQVLSFARGAEGEQVEVQIKHVFREIEGIMREIFPRSIEIRTNFAKDLWTVTGDATQMHQVLMNVCLNARDAMPGGGKLVLTAENVRMDETYARVHLDAKPISYVLLKVEDTGSGMSPEVQEKVFDPFFTTKEVDKGTGLGLATSRSIVKAHGGFISVYSEVGKGSSFKIYLPARVQKAPDLEEGPQRAKPMGEGELILVVDDESAVRDITRQILETYGYRVITAGNGGEALALYAERNGEIRVIITDMMMPYMDGAAMIRAIKKIDPKARIIASSGLAANEQASGAQGLGVDVFMAKPYKSDALLEALREVIGAVP